MKREKYHRWTHVVLRDRKILSCMRFEIDAPTVKTMQSSSYIVQIVVAIFVIVALDVLVVSVIDPYTRCKALYNDNSSW